MVMQLLLLVWLFLYLNGLPDAGLMEASNLEYPEDNIEIKTQTNTTQEIPESLDGQISETLGNIVKEKIEIVPWVIPKSSYFTPWFEENNLKENTEMRDQKRDYGDVNTKMERDMMIWNTMSIEVYLRFLNKFQILNQKIIIKHKSIPKFIMMRVRNNKKEARKKDSRACKINSHISK